MAVRDVTAIELGQTYLELHHQIHRLLEQRMATAGLSLARAKVLMRLGEGGPMNQATLAGLLGHVRRSVTETIDALERDGLVARTDDERDRRARIVALTPAGDNALATAQIVRSEAMDEIFGSLSTRDRAVLSGLLTTIRHDLQSGAGSCGY